MLLLLRLLQQLWFFIGLSFSVDIGSVVLVTDAFSVAPSPIRRTAPSLVWAVTGRGDDEEVDFNSNALQSSASMPAIDNKAATAQLQQRSPTDLVNIILQYEQQMQSFAIQAQREKLRAVREAEDALMEKWALTSTPGSSGSGWLPSSPSTPLVQQRDAKIVTEGSRNTRWGPQEIARIQSGAGRVGGGPPSSSSSIVTPASTATAVISDDTIAAADHGLRADGGVGGPTLADRLRGTTTVTAPVSVVPSSVVTIDAAVKSATSISTPTKSDAFAQRTANVAQQGSRNTRWGAQEIQRVQQQGVGSELGGPSSSFASGPALPSSVVTMGSAAGVPTDMIQQADHGLRADGSVGGPTLADRVNVGAQLVWGTTTTSSSAAMPVKSSSNEYAQRNDKIRAQDTRWGPQEIARVTGTTSIGSVAGGPASTAAAAALTLQSSVVTLSGTAPTVPTDIITAADHGLRADGGVGGPTLADRVNSGAQLIASATAEKTPRDAKVAAQGNLNTRWGPQEVARVQAAGGATGLATGGAAPIGGGILPSSIVTIGEASSAPVPNDVIAAADHGLRADGGVGGPTLAERLNANDVGSAAPAATATGVSVPPPVNGHTAESPSVFFATISVVSNEYRKRNEKVAESGGKNTRWGAQEIARVQTGATATGLVTGGPVSSVARGGVLPSSVVTIGSLAVSAVDAATIAAADHGLRADGGVGGPTLADRLNNVNVGAQIVSHKGPTSTSSTVAAEYERRNSKVAEAGAKNTRWGAQEIARVTKGAVGLVTGGPSSSAAAPLLRSSVVTLNGSGAQENQASVSKDTIVAADHGLRADGGVGGPTLADRLLGAVNVGAQVVSAAAPSTLYEQRNKQVAAAASQSRWGAQEVNRIQNGTGAVGSNDMKVGTQIQLVTS